MGMMGRILGMGSTAKTVGDAVTGVAEVFVGNRAERDAAEHAQFTAALGQYGAEFGHAGVSRFDGFVNALNRLPRPMLALGTLGLFVYAMAAPAGFSLRMRGLALVPEPLWWLLGAIVSFYFGARELHYRRTPQTATLIGSAQRESTSRTVMAPTAETAPPAAAPGETAAPASGAAAPVVVRASDPQFNAAIEEWRGLSA